MQGSIFTKNAGEGHYARRSSEENARIGISPQVIEGPKVVCTKGDWQVDDGILLTVEKRRLCSTANDVLLVKQDD